MESSSGYMLETDEISFSKRHKISKGKKNLIDSAKLNWIFAIYHNPSMFSYPQCFQTP